MKTTGNKEHPSAQFRLFSSEDNFPGKGGVINAIEICSRVWDLEYGLQVRLFDQLKTGSLYTYKETRDNDEQLFNLYVTNLPVALITDAVIIDTGNIFSPIDLFLTGSGSFMTADIYAPELRMLQIQFNEQWISKNYPEHQYESISEVLSATIVPSIKTKETGTDIFNAIGARNDDDLIFRFQHNILTLISSVVKEICPLDTEEINNRSPLIEALIQITKDNIFGSLPPIKDIAAKLTTSDSSLQRHFKDIFQKSIYEYYLDLKMSAAAELLSTGSHSVKEVAFRLGYEDVSSFILVFKKYAGVLPGSIKKKSTSTITEVKNMFFLKP